VSRATTQLHATQQFSLDARGLTPGDTRADASTSIVYEQINAPGFFAFRRNAAIRETYARRRQAESESAAYAVQSIREQIREEGDEMARQFNESYFELLRDPRIKAHRPAPEIRVRTSDGMLYWECRLDGPREFAAFAPPPDIEPDGDVVMLLTASAMEEQASVELGGRTLNGEELSSALGTSLLPNAQDDSEDVSVTFELDPCDIRFEDGAIHTRLHVASFDSGDVNYPAMTVDFVYMPEERDGDVVLVRQERLRVIPISSGNGEAPVQSGRQQTLRLALQRRLERWFTDELGWSDATLPLPGEDDTVLHLRQARLAGPWLELRFSTTSP
jgi:hypothetical protein